MRERKKFGRGLLLTPHLVLACFASSNHPLPQEERGKCDKPGHDEKIFATNFRAARKSPRRESNLRRRQGRILIFPFIGRVMAIFYTVEAYTRSIFGQAKRSNRAHSFLGCGNFVRQGFAEALADAIERWAIEKRGILYFGAFFEAESGQIWQISTGPKQLKNMGKIVIFRALRDVCATPPGKAPSKGSSDPFEH
jgi:hypothetical protein